METQDSPHSRARESRAAAHFPGLCIASARALSTLSQVSSQLLSPGLRIQSVSEPTLDLNPHQCVRSLREPSFTEQELSGFLGRRVSGRALGAAGDTVPTTGRVCHDVAQESPFRENSHNSECLQTRAVDILIHTEV